MRKEVRIAILFIVAVVVSIWGYNFVKGKNLLNKSYTFYIKMDNTHGVEASTPVMINGLAIGNVAKVQLDDNMHSIIVVMDVSKDYDFPKGTVAEIVSTGLMGGKAINLSFNSVCTTNCAEDGDTLNYTVKGILANMFGDDDLSDYMGSVKNSVGGILDSIDSGLRRNADEEGFSKLVIDLQKTITNLKFTTESLNNLLLNSSGNINKMMNDLQSITGNIKSSNKDITELLANANGVVKQVSDANVGNTIEGLNNSMASFQTTLNEANGVMENLSTITNKINSGEGTLGQLINDDELYKNLDTGTKNLELLLQDIRLNPRRYINISIIGKKDKGYEIPENDPAFQDQ